MKLATLLACMIIAIPAAALADEETSAAGNRFGDQPVRDGSQRVLDFSEGPVVITEPGLYVLGRSWSVFPDDTSIFVTVLTIAADDVVVDLNGFSLDFDGEVGTAVSIEGERVTLRNGRVSSQGPAVSGGARTALEKMSVGGFVRLGPNSRLIDSSVGAVRAHSVIIGDNGTVSGSNIDCFLGDCLHIGSGSTVVETTFRFDDGEPQIQVRGDGNFVVRNTVIVDFSVGPYAFAVEGNDNVLRDNLVLIHPYTSGIIGVNGTRNTLDGNIAAPREQFDARAATGIAFMADGNYYGDNRMAAVTPFVLGATRQTDWGGNVGY